MVGPDYIPGQSHYFGGGAIETALNPTVLVILVITAVLILVLPRKYVIVPALVTSILVPLGQAVVAGGMHWQVYRLVVVCGLLRVVVGGVSSRQPLFAGGFTLIDRAFVICMAAQAIGFVLQYMQTDALVNQFGVLLDFLGAYVFLRFAIRDQADIFRALKCLAVLTVVLGVCMVREQITLNNIFGNFGLGRSVPEIREGKIRSQGSFQHSLTAGTFGAILLPLFFLLWKNGRARVLAVSGIIGCTAMTICSHSSTPLLTYVAGILGTCIWFLRQKMRRLRWVLVGSVLALQIVMKAPFWFLIAHIDLTGGSSGYHRALLIDMFIRHFWDWWLIGTKDAGSWDYDLWDQQNQFVSAGETGGLIALIFFVAVISYSFAFLGKARRIVEGRRREWEVWFLGCSLFATITGFFGVNLYDQSKIVYVALLAMIVAVTAPILKDQADKRPSTDPADAQSGSDARPAVTSDSDPEVLAAY